eukprot:TRINITY_DN44849_c0_g3_i1.p1 TRINITY_DN44849_c0_g3~~TRINITY_DN44849_c0_g3_i1.p1  ORF type:complete len:292 (-),score=65.57 TRINITY_DN44849_c0_g3_i1:12-824(-)
MELNENSLILEFLCRKRLERRHTPCERCYVTHNKRLLHPMKTFKDYGIEDGSSVNFQLRGSALMGFEDYQFNLVAADDLELDHLALDEDSKEMREYEIQAIHRAVNGDLYAQRAIAEKELAKLDFMTDPDMHQVRQFIIQKFPQSPDVVELKVKKVASKWYENRELRRRRLRFELLQFEPAFVRKDDSLTISKIFTYKWDCSVEEDLPPFGNFYPFDPQVRNDFENSMQQLCTPSLPSEVIATILDFLEDDLCSDIRQKTKKRITLRSWG